MYMRSGMLVNNPSPELSLYKNPIIHGFIEHFFLQYKDLGPGLAKMFHCI